MNQIAFDFANIKLSEEQQHFIDLVKQGNNVLVDACIGSGKTTSIQHLCKELKDKKILYLTYNKLLKVDAREKLKGLNNVLATNYHGYVYWAISRRRLKTRIESCISDYINYVNNGQIWVPKYDILIIDEYQDIDSNIAELLLTLKRFNPSMQLVAVGDFCQKIYDKTSLDISSFITEYMKPYVGIEFTKCFRLNETLASALGYVWDKTINGVNTDCKVEILSFEKVFDILSESDPKDVLCLGSNRGTDIDCIRMLNRLESEVCWKYNKKTVYAKVGEGEIGSVDVSKNCAIFVPFDSSKGLERDICVVFNWTSDYWKMRCGKQGTKYEILRNIFCVAASRGKKRVIFVLPEKVENKEMLTFSNLKSDEYCVDSEIGKVGMSSAFDYKYQEDIMSAYDALELYQILDKGDVIDVNTKDGMIDISSCIGHYQEFMYFHNNDIDKEIQMYFDLHTGDYYLKEVSPGLSLEKKILYLAYLNTRQLRYMNQVSVPFVSDEERIQIFNRLSEQLNSYESVQKECTISTDVGATIKGYADVIKDNKVWELKFVNELEMRHFLQCALYMIALGIDEGILWNVKSNEMWSVRIPDKQLFMNRVITAISKHEYLECGYVTGCEVSQGIVVSSKSETLEYMSNLVYN